MWPPSCYRPTHHITHYQCWIVIWSLNLAFGLKCYATYPQAVLSPSFTPTSNSSPFSEEKAVSVNIHMYICIRSRWRTSEPPASDHDSNTARAKPWERERERVRAEEERVKGCAGEREDFQNMNDLEVERNNKAKTQQKWNSSVRVGMKQAEIGAVNYKHVFLIMAQYSIKLILIFTTHTSYIS